MPRVGDPVRGIRNLSQAPLAEVAQLSWRWKESLLQPFARAFANRRPEASPEVVSLKSNKDASMRKLLWSEGKEKESRVDAANAHALGFVLQ